MFITFSYAVRQQWSHYIKNKDKQTRAAFWCTHTNADVNGKLELTLLKGRQRFDTVSTSNLKV